jgi:glutamate carboxypeptidase
MLDVKTESRTIAERFLCETYAFLRSLVGINSFTENNAGVRAVAERIAAQFAPLGFGASFHPATNPRHGPHLVLQRAGLPDGPTLALVSHLDTVFPAEEEIRCDFRYREEGRRIYGPGTNDIKGGTAMIWLTLQVLRQLAPEWFDRTNWFVLHNACEEVISDDFRQLCLEHLPRETLACLIFEADGGGDEDFSLVASRKGRAVFRVEVEGRASHAGTQHRSGVNAITHLATVIGALEGETDYATHVTVNVGSVSGRESSAARSPGGTRITRLRSRHLCCQAGEGSCLKPERIASPGRCPRPGRNAAVATQRSH